MATYQVSVAIPALNEEHYLPGLLRSLCAQRDVALDVVVVEAHSEDRTVEVVREVAAANTNPQVEIRVFTVEQRNVSIQRNFAVSHTRFPILLFFDADIRLPHPHWVRNVVRTHEHRRAAISTCRFKPIEPNPIGYLYYALLFVFHRLMRWINPYALGAMLLTSREMFDRVGGFDSGLVINEDANFVKANRPLGRFEVLHEACQILRSPFPAGWFLEHRFDVPADLLAAHHPRRMPRRHRLLG